ncbi:hypothetical protein [Xenorhabdus griffiniae]|uniref:Uncharacterized protein n=1 Tax=Xenorhabdus griffiniae TaxID=351672 RepID=A0ABY9XDE2_9GAMM|nr:hypothetical protein [Xenorhabdus griffiniae]MBD1229569.1 hypothetical protein [Xenorhabdus griffiniae]MBE8589399.1 hypothetical protein [Xenorhabdus griffiniae]WMV70932.1 hypothetical protein QL128_12010 [Xenorhabdus griffiniae]WNH00608.1 hypothetical protein QL112_012015 [Xenorhabdus griffiniae]
MTMRILKLPYCFCTVPYMWQRHMIELEDIVSPMALSLRHFGGSVKEGNFGIETHANDVTYTGS